MNWREGRTLKSKETQRGMPDDQWLKDVAPALNELLTDVQGDKEGARAGTLLLFAEDGRWKVCVNDRNHQMVLWLTRDSLGPDFFGWVSSAMERSKDAWRANRSSNGQSFRSGRAR